MECAHCGEKWTLTEYETKHMDYPDKCPFCGNSTSGFSSNSAVLLRQLIRQKGVSVLQNPKMLIGFISDLLVQNPRELKALKIAISENICVDFMSMVGVDDIEIRRIRHKIFKYITDDIGLSDDRAEFIINTFMYALAVGDEDTFANVNKTYSDSNSAYYFIADEYIKQKEFDNAFEALIISADSGNIKAIEKIKKLAEVRLCEPDNEKWFAWNRKFLEIKSSYESSYIVAMCIANGLGTEMSVSDKDHWLEGKEYNEEAITEFVARQMLEFFSADDFRGSVKELSRVANMGFEPAKCIMEVINDVGVDDWDLYLDGIIDDDMLDDEYFIEQKARIAVIMAEYHYSNYIETERYSILLDEERIVYVWYYIALKYADRIYGLEVCQKIINCKCIGLKQFGLHALENLDDEQWGNHILGLEYLKGDILGKDYDKAFKMFSNSYESESAYYLARMCFFGCGTNASLKTTIKHLELELLNYTSKYDMCNSKNEYRLALVIPLLIQCYYEDLLLTDSVSSLEKLQVYADDWKWPSAIRYLYWYYSENSNYYRDAVETEKYKKMLELYNGMIPIHDSLIYRVIRKRAARKCKKIAELYEDHNLLSVCDYAIFCEDVIPSNGNRWNERKIDTLFYLACAFTIGNGVRKNYLRAEIYLRRYFEAKGDRTVGLEENYVKALRLRSLLRATNWNCKEDDLFVKNWRREARNLEGSAIDEEKIKYYIEHEKNSEFDLYNDVEAAIKLGYQDRKTYLIGVGYMIGTEGFTIDRNKGFEYLKKFYNDYLSFNLESELPNNYDVATVEFFLSLCYLEGEVTEKDIDLGVELLKRIVEHADKNCVHYLYVVGMLFLTGKLYGIGEVIELPENTIDFIYAFKAFKKLEKLGDDMGKILLGKFYMYGREPAETDYEKALSLFREAYDCNNSIVSARDSIAELPIEITIGNKYGWQIEKRKVLLSCSECGKPFYHKLKHFRFYAGEIIRCPLCSSEIRARKFKAKSD